MIIRRFRASNFRNIESCDIEFTEGVNLLYGRNAQGKTNAVEGIYIFSRGKSFRAREDSELVKFGTEGFRISVEYDEGIHHRTLEYALFGKERLRKKNGYKINKVTEMIGSLKCVLFYPDDLKIVKGGPEERRGFLNVAVSLINGTYLKMYSDYKKALENRNCALKFISKGFPVTKDELWSWSESMAEYASYIYLEREKYIENLSKYAGEVMLDISEGAENLSLIHECDIEVGLRERDDVRRAYLKLFTENLDREISAGVSLYGPHRDDIKIKINDKDSRIFASQGQQRSAVLSLKLAEGELIKDICGEYPVYLFDDVLSELDDKRKRYVLSGAEGKQFIITSCEAEDLLGYTDNEIDVSGGKYVSAHR